MSIDDKLREHVISELNEFDGGVRRFEASRGLKKWALHGFLDRDRKQSPSLQKAEEICKALGLEIFIEPSKSQKIDTRAAGWQISDNPGKVQLYGYAGAGGEVAYDGEFHHGEVVPAPPGNENNLAAVEVRGDSAAPYLREGDIVYFYPDYPANPHQHVGRLVLATTVDGAAYIKILRKGDSDGVWNLESINPKHYLMENMELQRISPLVWIHYKNRENQFKRV